MAGMAGRIYKLFLERSCENLPFIVGIDGLGGAGKTGFSKGIEQELKARHCEVHLFHLDDHIVRKHRRYETGNESWHEYYFLQWDLGGMVADLFEPLCERESVHLPFYNKSADTLTTARIEIKPNSIVLIEGVFLQRREWRSYFDFVIFLHCPDEVRRERVLTRDSYIGNREAILRKYTDRYWPAEKYYMDKIRPANIADMVINNSRLRK